MKESDVQNQFRQSVQLSGGYYIKLPDMPRMGNSRFVPPKPFDSIVIYRGVPIAIEFKIHKSDGAFPFNKVAPHQIESLLEMKRNGGYGFIVIRVWAEKNDFLVAVDVNTFIAYALIYEGDMKRKSLPLDIFRHPISENDFIFLDKTKFGDTPGRHWDLKNWFENLYVPLWIHGCRNGEHNRNKEIDISSKTKGF